MKKLILSSCAILVMFACSSDDDNSLSQCEIAIETTLTAMQDYNTATEENFVERCNAYKVALENQKQACGDSDGSLQVIIDSLGDCSDPSGDEVVGQISVTAGTLNIVFDEITITQSGSTLQVSGQTSAANSYSIYFEVEENMVGDDVFQNFEIKLISTYSPVPSNFNNNVSTNSGGTLAGTFSGVVENNDGGQIGLTSGNFDLSF